MSRVDVIIPCYKYAHYLRGCVGSVLDQSMPDLRILIIDDASPDDTADVAESLVASDSRVHLIRHAVNRGHIATYNRGLEWAESDYTVLLSADDLLAPGALARGADLMDGEAGVGLVYGRGIPFRGDQPPGPAACGLGARRIVRGTEFIEACCDDGGNPVCTPTAMVRTTIQKQVGGYRADLPHSGDMEMWLRFAAYSDIAYLDSTQAFYRIHSRNMSLLYLDGMEVGSYVASIGDLKQRKAAFEALFHVHGERIADRVRLQAAAGRSVAWAAFWGASTAFDRGDAEASLELLDFASTVWPEIAVSPEWARLRWKRKVGSRVWRSLGPVVKILRGRRGHPVRATP